MKNIKKFLLSITTILILVFSAICLTACGENAKTIMELYLKYGDEYSNSLYLNMTYGETVGSLMNNLDYYFLYSNGDRVEINEDNFTEEEINQLAQTYRESYYICTGHDETTYNPIWEEYEESISGVTELEVGQYRFEFEISGKVAKIYLTVNKGEYTGSVSMALQPSSMTYGGQLSQPRLLNNYNLREVENIVYYYREVKEDQSEQNFWYTYTYQQGAICELLPRNYEMYAEIETKNYNTISTSIYNFTVNKAVKTNYALFTGDGVYVPQTNGQSNLDHYIYTRYNESTTNINVNYQFGKDKISDYISLLQSRDIFICEVDERGNIIFDNEYTPIHSSITDYYFLNGENEYVAWSTNYGTLYVESNGEKVLNTSPEIDWNKTYYRAILHNQDYREPYTEYSPICMMYKDYIYSYVEFPENGEEYYFHNGEEYVLWSTSYNKVFIEDGDEKVLNNSSVIDATANYYVYDASFDNYNQISFCKLENVYNYIGAPVEEFYFYNGQEYVAWSTNYNTLYVKDGNNKVLNTSQEIDWSKTYFYLYNAWGNEHYYATEIYFAKNTPRFATSLSEAYGSQYNPLTLNGSDQNVTSAQVYTVRFNFSEDASKYQERYIPNLTIKLNLQKAKINLPTSINIDDTYQNSVEYDGEEHHISIYEPFRFEDNEWGGDYIGNYVYENGRYYYVDYSFRDNDNNPIKIFEIINFAKTNAGTYTVMCSLLSQWTDLVQLEYESNSGNTLNIGSWTIEKKEYHLDYNLKINDEDVENFLSDNTLTLIYGETYNITAENLQAYRLISVEDGEPERENDNNVNASISVINVLYYNSGGYINAPGVTIEGTQVSFLNNCPQYIILQITFSLGNNNYKNVVVERNAEIKQAVTYAEEIVATIKNVNDNWKLNYILATSIYNDEMDYYYILDNGVYEKWLNNYTHLYVDDGLNKVPNNSSTIDLNKNYYVYRNAEYTQVYIYYANIEEVNSVNQTISNDIPTVKYDGREKIIAEAEVALTNISAQRFSDVYSTIYYSNTEYIEAELRYETTYIQNNSSIIDWNKCYYKKVGDDYIQLYLYKKVGDGYVYVSEEVDGVTDYYVAENNHYLTKLDLAYIIPDAQAFSDVYSTLYVYENGYYDEDSVYHEGHYELNLSTEINWNRSYYIMVDPDNFDSVYFYYKVGEAYVSTYQLVNGVSEYYISSNYSHETTNLEKFVNDEWVFVEKAIEPGLYRSAFDISLSGNRILVDVNGKLVKNVKYIWQIVEGLTEIQVTNCSISFKDKNNTVLVKDSNNTVTIDFENLPVYFTISISLDLSVNYRIHCETSREGDTTGYSVHGNSNYTNEGDIYHTKVYFVFDDEYCLKDSQNNVIEYLTLDWCITVNPQAE